MGEAELYYIFIVLFRGPIYVNNVLLTRIVFLDMEPKFKHLWRTFPAIVGRVICWRTYTKRSAALGGGFFYTYPLNELIV